MKTRKIGKYLRFKKEYIKKIFDGEKTTTIRKGILSPSRDIVYLESEGKIYGELALKSVRYTKVANLKESDARADGFKNLKELKDVLNDIYPDIKDSDWITIIRFKPISRLEEPFKKIDILDEDQIYKISRLALAYDLPKTFDEKKIFSLLVYYRGNMKRVIREHNTTYEEIYCLLKKYSKKLKKYLYDSKH